MCIAPIRHVYAAMGEKSDDVCSWCTSEIYLKYSFIGHLKINSPQSHHLLPVIFVIIMHTGHSGDCKMFIPSSLYCDWSAMVSMRWRIYHVMLLMWSFFSTQFISLNIRN